MDRKYITLVMTVIPECGKDKRHFDRFGPITLLNADYKLFTLIIGKDHGIIQTNEGLLKRPTHNNTRLVLDLWDYNSLIDGRGFI